MKIGYAPGESAGGYEDSLVRAESVVALEAMKGVKGAGRDGGGALGATLGQRQVFESTYKGV